MNIPASSPNLLLSWLWIGLGFLSGAALGLGFARENWLGGYTSLRRRLYRLGHVSFFGLGAVNLAFHLTRPALGDPPLLMLQTASWAFILGALTMPVCCLVMAHRPEARPALLFALPVVSLLVGGALTLWMLLPS